MKNYNAIDWGSLVVEDCGSPTGLIWKVDRYHGKGMKVRFIKAGDFAGHIKSYKDRDFKYVVLKFNNQEWKVHRILWVMRNGFISDKSVIDHIDGNGLNNSVENLRLVSFEINTRNRKMQNNNTSGKTGVKFQKVRKHNYAVAYWMDNNGKQQHKLFSIEKLGLLPAYAAACKYREFIIKHMNNQGFGYTERHGE